MEPPIQSLHTLLRYPDSHLTESELLSFWRFFLDRFDTISTSSGSKLQIIEPGRINSSDGPDIKSVKIAEDGTVRSGDVEIHRQSVDWYHHGHQHDPNFNTVVFHVCLVDDGTPIRRQDEQFIETIELDSYLTDAVNEYKSSLTDDIESRVQSIQRPCHVEESPTKTASEYREHLKRIADSWLGWKSAKIRKINPDDRELTSLLECLGLTRNHKQFRRFGERLSSARFYKQIRTSNPLEIEALLLGKAGWLSRPFQSSNSSINTTLYRRRSTWESTWKHEKPVLRSRTWSLGSVRPHANPIRRLVVFGWASKRLNGTWKKWLDNKIASLTAKSHSFRPRVHELLDDLFEIPEINYWNHHYSRTDTYRESVPNPVGESWYDQVIINWIFPLLYLRSLESDNAELRECTRKTFYNYPPVMENRRTRRLISQWDFHENFDWNSVAEQQAGVFLYKKGCKNNKCEKCPLNRTTSTQPKLFKKIR